MKIITLGTTSAYPSPNRGVSCTAVAFEDSNVWLFDCGEGSQIQIQKSCLKLSHISKIFITHLHGDHVFGLPGLLCTMGVHLSTTVSDGVHIYGPIGIRKFLRTSLSLSYSTLPFSYTVHELVPDKVIGDKDDLCQSKMESTDPLHPQEEIGADISAIDSVWTLYEDDAISVKAGALDHLELPCFGYVINESDRPGKLDANLLMKIGVPKGPLYGQIKNGCPVTLSDGSILKPEDVIGPPIKGRKIVILGDTSNPYRMSNVARDCDILLHEATFENGLKDKALEFGHSTSSMAASFAHFINAKKLVLFHFSHRYKTQYGSEDKAKDVEVLLNEANEMLESVGSKCQLLLACDLMSIKV